MVGLVMVKRTKNADLLQNFNEWVHFALVGKPVYAVG
jgi:hypothetical protein